MKFILIFSFVFIAGTSVYSQEKSNSGAEIVVRNLGPKINSEFDDFGAISTDKKTLFLASSRSKKDHMFVSKRKTDTSEWGEPVLINFTGGNQNSGGFSVEDSGKIFFATDLQTRTPGDVNIWIAEIIHDTLKVNPLPSPVNTKYFESQPSVTANGKDLYFATNRFSSKVELAVSHRISDSIWTEPKSLGSHVNQGSFTATLFISPDNKFLFFSCINPGSSDKITIYMASRTGSEDTAWSTPVLLPAPINSDANNYFPVVEKNGKKIYFASDRKGGYGKLDIYEATLPQDIQDKIFHSFPGY